MPNFLLFLPVPSDESLIYTGYYSYLWVAVSIFLAILASYAALNASTRIQDLHDTIAKLNWSIISAFTLGIGIWSMHFIGMLALKLPCVIHYDLFITLVSMVPAVLASGVALGVWHVGTKHLSPFVSSILLGAGIVTMHYTGMAAMRLEGFVGYNPILVVVSIIVAILLSYLALSVKGDENYLNKSRTALVAIMLGGAVSGTHYTGMFAASFVRGQGTELPLTDLTTNTLALIIAFTTVFLTLSALALASISRNRQITKQLRASEERLKIANASGQVGIWDLNLKTNELVWDDTMFTLYRTRREDFSGAYDAWSTRLHPEDKESASYCTLFGN